MGAVTSTGLYTAPSRSPESSSVRIRAVSAADPDADDQSIVSIQDLKVTILPDRPSVKMGDKLRFTAKVEGSTNQQVRWYINDIAGGNATTGLIDASGLHNPGQTAPPSNLESQGR